MNPDYLESHSPAKLTSLWRLDRQIISRIPALASRRCGRDGVRWRGANETGVARPCGGEPIQSHFDLRPSIKNRVRPSTKYGYLGTFSYVTPSSTPSPVKPLRAVYEVHCASKRQEAKRGSERVSGWPRHDDRWLLA